MRSCYYATCDLRPHLRKLRCACGTHFGGTCDVRVCGAFLGVRSGIATLQLYFKIGRKSCFAVLSISYYIRGPYNFGTKLGNF